MDEAFASNPEAFNGLVLKIAGETTVKKKKYENGAGVDYPVTIQTGQIDVPSPSMHRTTP